MRSRDAARRWLAPGAGLFVELGDGRQASIDVVLGGLIGRQGWGAAEYRVLAPTQ